MNIALRIVQLCEECEKAKDINKYLELKRLCLGNLSVVGNLIFDNDLSSNIKVAILFDYSMDGEGCALENKSKWVEMMRKYVIPRMNEIEDSFIKGTIEWWQEVYAL